jgi:uncharacterized protein (DUF433 family)
MFTANFEGNEMTRLRYAKYRADVDPRELAMYSPAEVARFVGVHERTLGTWIYGRPYETSAGEKWFERVIVPADEKNGLLSFFNLAEAHILAATRYLHHVPLQRVRWAIETIQEKYPSPHPLISNDFFTDGKDIFIKKIDETENLTVPGKMNFKEILDLFLRHIERDENQLVSKVYPVIAGQPEDKAIAIIHNVSSGEPIISGTGVPVWVVYNRYDAGEKPESIAEDFDIPVEKVFRAINYVERKAA